MRLTKPLTWRDNPLMRRMTEDPRQMPVSVPSDQGARELPALEPYWWPGESETHGRAS
jgi:hypothetical protein